MRYPALQGKRDQNEPEIIEALEGVGATVVQNPVGKGQPDLIVGYMGVTYLLEVKMPGNKLNPKQVKWHWNWSGQVDVVTTPDEALAAIGALDKPVDQRCREAGL